METVYRNSCRDQTGIPAELIPTVIQGDSDLHSNRAAHWRARARSPRKHGGRWPQWAKRPSFTAFLSEEMGVARGADSALTMNALRAGRVEHDRPPCWTVAEMARQKGRDESVMHPRTRDPPGVHPTGRMYRGRDGPRKKQGRTVERLYVVDDFGNFDQPDAAEGQVPWRCGSGIGKPFRNIPYMMKTASCWDSLFLWIMHPPRADVPLCP